MREALFLAILLSATTPLIGQDKQNLDKSAKAEEQRSASDAHSFMELFGKLEREWAFAAQRRDQNVLGDIMADEFIERDATDPDTVITREQWMQERLPDYHLDPVQIHSMIIRAFLGNAVVSFVQRQGKPGAGEGVEYFIVDVWVANHGRWQVASRFSGPVPRGGVRGR